MGLLHELLTWPLMMKHLLLLLRLKLTPLRRGRKGHPKKILNQPRSLSLSLSPSPRPRGKRGRPSPSMVTMRSLLLLCSFHLPLSTLPLFTQLHLYSLPFPMFLPTPSLSLNPQPFPSSLHPNLSSPLNLSLHQRLSQLHL